MTKQEALDLIIGGLPDPENFTDALDILKNNIETEGLSQEGESGEWRSKYEKMREEYFKRWGEETKPTAVKNVVDESIMSGFSKEEEPVTINDLDMSFDGRTE